MNRRLIATAIAGGFTSVLGINVLAQNQLPDSQAESNSSHDGLRNLVYDVACDARTFRLNKGGTLMDAQRGDGFIVKGKIYPAGTIPPGGTVENPGPFDADTTPGSIGSWACRGTFNFDIGEILARAHPHLFRHAVQPVSEWQRFSP